MNPLTKGRNSDQIRNVPDLRLKSAEPSPITLEVSMHRSKPSVDDLRCLFSYDPESGIVLRADGSDPTRINKRGYRYISTNRFNYYAHTVAFVLMTGQFPTDTVDHKDLDTLNNRWLNLRPATQAQQQVNRKLFKNNKSGFRGVYRSGKKWIAQIRFDKKTYSLGTFGTAEAAAEVVQNAREVRWGEFARVS